MTIGHLDGTECSEGVDAGNHGYVRTDCEFNAQVSFILNPDEPGVVIGSNDPEEINIPCDEEKMNQCDATINDPQFDECGAVIDKAEWIDNCRHDVCAIQVDDALVAATLVDVKNNMLGQCVEIVQRNPDVELVIDPCTIDSGITCAENMHYKNCAQPSDIQTCEEFMDDFVPFDDGSTFGSCVCNENFKTQGNNYTTYANVYHLTI